MLTLKAARDLIARHVEPLAPATVRSADAAGCRLAVAVDAITDWPADDVSTMDGYAARAADLATSRTLTIAFEVPAGHSPPELPPGQCARIFTGAPLPAGADVVIPQEDAQRNADQVRLPNCDAGCFVRRRGEVCRSGDRLGEPGTVVTPQLLGLIVAVGPAAVAVVPRPRVGILTTGTELLAADADLAPACIRDSNGPMLTALARCAGLPMSSAECSADSVESIAGRLASILESSDLVVTSGGVSVGDYDLLPAAIQELGGELLFHRVSIRPGKPVLTARVRSTWLVGLPGNPASTFVGWHAFGRPLAERLAGAAQDSSLRTVTARLAEPVENPGARTFLRPARLDYRLGEFSVAPLPWKGSHDIMTLAEANALLRIDPGQKLEPGAPAECLVLHGLPD